MRGMESVSQRGGVMQICALEGGGHDIAEDNNGGGGQAGRNLLPHKVVQRGVRRDLGALADALAHHIHSCTYAPATTRQPLEKDKAVVEGFVHLRRRFYQT